MKRSTADPEPGIDDAMNRVLAAEQAARDAVDGCRRQADAIITGAEAAARAVSSRAERRMRLAHGIADRGIERALSALRSAESTSPESLPDPGRIDAVVARLARELTEPDP
jgi:regulator of protease activity HflC (stomatin/prohibitin superfamily)